MVNFLKSGKVKDVYELPDNRLEFRFTNRISVFDKIIPCEIEHKGEVLCRIAAFWFKRAEKLGINTHFLDVKLPDKIIVKRVAVIDDYARLKKRKGDYLIPLEIIARYYVAGSLYDALKSGKIQPKELGFRNNNQKVEYGTKLPDTYIECTTKFEKIDRKLTLDESLEIANITKTEFNHIRETILKIDEDMQNQLKKSGIIHVDGKKEFAFDEDRTLLVVDTYGTPDEDRFWDESEYKKGNFIELSKEYVRQYYRMTGYYAKLTKARNEGKDEPPIPALPDTERKKVSEIYISLYEKFTGEKFRWNDLGKQGLGKEELGSQGCGI